jgi:hypothetical protein
LPKKLNLVLLVALLFLYLSAGLAFAQDEESPEEPAEQPFTVYTLGQQTLSISAGLFIPLFFQSFDWEYAKTNLKLGAAGSLQWGIHLSNNWMTGIEVGGMISKDINDQPFFMLPITAKGTYIIHFFPFEFPIFVGTGLNFVKLGNKKVGLDALNLTWIIKPGFSTIWKYNVNWGFGLNVVYWWVPQFWSDDSDKGRMGNFLEITLTAQYNF